jgi:hypothetical protein
MEGGMVSINGAICEEATDWPTNSHQGRGSSEQPSLKTDEYKKTRHAPFTRNLMRNESLRIALILVALLTTPWRALAQTVQENRTLVVTGQPGQAPVIQVKGRSYVDVEELARLTNGSLSFKGSQIILTLPTSAASAALATPLPSAAANSALSKDFLKAAIETMAVIREWRTALVSAVRNGVPVTDDSDAGYRTQAAKDLRLVSVAVSTDADRDAYPLFSQELSNMQKFSGEIIAAHDSMQNISPDALKDDPSEQQTLRCARSLTSMLSSGQFQDDGSCH